MAEPLLVVSSGFGIQSWTLLHMMDRGAFGLPKPDLAITADTVAEQPDFYEYIRLAQHGNMKLSYPVEVVSAGDLRADILANAAGEQKTGKRATIPAFVDGPNGSAILSRHCTNDYKIQPIRRRLREILGYSPKARIPEGAVTLCIGISADEAIREKPSAVKWITNRHPLLEPNIRMTRWDCKVWLTKNELPIPGPSACDFCPFRKDSRWREMKINDPESFERACQTDEGLRGGFEGSGLPTYLHRSLVPLRDVDFSNLEDLGQDAMWGEFGDECEGMCGV